MHRRTSPETNRCFSVDQHAKAFSTASQSGQVQARYVCGGASGRLAAAAGYLFDNCSLHFCSTVVTTGIRMQGIHLRLQQLCHLPSHYGFQFVGDGKSAFAHNKKWFHHSSRNKSGALVRVRKTQKCVQSRTLRCSVSSLSTGWRRPIRWRTGRVKSSIRNQTG